MCMRVCVELAGGVRASGMRDGMRLIQTPGRQK